MATEERIELDEERRREIDELDGKLLEANFFEILGVPNGAPVEEVRAAFLQLSRRLHPDRFYGKNLGAYRAKVDRIFKRLVEANQTLSDPRRRQEYLDAHPFVRAAVRATREASPEVAADQPRSEVELERDKERRARLARHPYLLKAVQVQDLLAKARESIAKKEYSLAFTHLNNAAQADPTNADVKALLADVRRKNDVDRAEGNYKHGLEALEREDPTLALQAFRSAASGGHANAAAKAAALLEKAGDLKEAGTMAQKAVDLQPRSWEFRVLASRIFDAAGMKALAKKHADEAEKLEPPPDAKKQVKKRWPF